MQAKKNQNYYLREQAEVGGDWFRFVKTMEPYKEKVSITPRMAKELLDSQQISLRKPRLKSDEVTISFSGNLLAGKHLLENILEEKQSKEVTIVFNVLNECYA
jgi:hypothetical protein